MLFYFIAKKFTNALTSMSDNDCVVYKFYGSYSDLKRVRVH